MRYALLSILIILLSGCAFYDGILEKQVESSMQAKGITPADLPKIPEYDPEAQQEHLRMLLEEVAKEAKSINFSDGVDKFETRILARKHWLKKSQFYFQANEIFVVDRDIYWIVGLNPEYTLGCEYMARTEILLYDPICVDKTTGDIEDLAGPVYFNKETEDIKYSPEPSEEPIRLRLR